MNDKVKMPFLKRLFDIVLSLFAIIILLPLFCIILLAILIEHILIGRPFASLFYEEIRISQGEKFILRKFNIFTPGVVEKMRKDHIFIHTKDLEHDEKSITFTGKILRNIYMDELPQLFAILKGDISFVGPRPVNLEVYDKLVDRGIITKTVIKTGLTGNYQCHKGEPGKNDQVLDMEYIKFCKNNSQLKIILNDIRIMLLTVKVVFKAEGI